MGVANFIKKNFFQREICIFLGDEAESLNYDQATPINWAYYRGVVVDVDTEDNIITLEIPGVGLMYIDCEYSVKAFWEPNFDLHRAMRTSLTRRMVGAKYKGE